eukprot:TRINITY_DN186_c0_g2_i1.p1 TRINITY_DN186_c0_g2~~TRINITY_DN186_c0_g2_i1.p1  ORF type:complete len:508 (+),score=99.01 TRINITY_DN186_c0_g2_i1:190-1713(+)
MRFLQSAAILICTTVALAASYTPSGCSSSAVCEADTRKCRDATYRLECGSGERIKVHTAVYGRSDATTCSANVAPSQLANVACAVDVIGRVRSKCDGRRRCTVKACDNWLQNGDPCPSIRKYLTTDYACVPRRRSNDMIDFVNCQTDTSTTSTTSVSTAPATTTALFCTGAHQVAHSNGSCVCEHGYSGPGCTIYDSWVYCSEAQSGSLSGVTRIKGGVYLAGCTMTNLDMFASVENIDGYFVLNQNPSLVDISGIAGLRSVAWVAFWSNPGVTSFTALRVWQSVTPILSITSMPISTLDGLENAYTATDMGLFLGDNINLANITALSRVRSSIGIRIKGHTQLADLTGLHNIENATMVQIEDNTGLDPTLPALRRVDELLLKGQNSITNLAAFQSIVSVTDRLSLISNANLASLSGLAIPQLQGQLLLENNPMLTDLSSLATLTRVVDLEIKRNAALTTLTGLQNIASAGEILIEGNPILTSIAALNGVIRTNCTIVQSCCGCADI